LDGTSELHNKIRGVKNLYEKAIDGINTIKNLNPNIHEYERKMGKFNCDYNNHTPGHKIMTQAKLINTFSEILMGEDKYLYERKKLKKLVHKYTDGMSCKRASLLIDELLMY
jgi:CDP-glycerol glycerophosphotransferase (TagB/SpsB family)